MAAGAFMIVLYSIGLYIKGTDALHDALDPLASKTYLVLLAFVPGAFLLWPGDHIAARRHQASSGWTSMNGTAPTLTPCACFRLGK